MTRSVLCPSILDNPGGRLTAMAKEGQLYYVQDARTYVGNSVMWWAPEWRGYTTHIDRAGKYTAEEVAKMRDTDIPWRVEDVDKVWSQHVDMQDLRRLDDGLVKKSAETVRKHKSMNKSRGVAFTSTTRRTSPKEE